MGEVYNWKSNIQNNYFAPIFNVSIWIDNLNESLIDNLLRIAINNKLVYENDKWEHYNVFSWDYDDSINLLKEKIKISYLNFCSKLNVKSEKNIWIRGWIYPQKRGMKLSRHIHAIHENSFLSGNICLTQNNTTTDFDIPYIGWIQIKNEKGRMTLFPSSLPHAVEELNEDTRYTLAFDLITEKGINYFYTNNTNLKDSLHLSVPL